MKRPPRDVRFDPELRTPTAVDGTAVQGLLEDCLEHEREGAGRFAAALANFGATSAVALSPEGRLVGFVVGYRLPNSPARLFVDRVVVHPLHRRRGLALEMLLSVLRLPGCAGVRYAEGVTRTPAVPSAPRALWDALGRELRATVAAVPFSVGAAADPPWVRLHLGPFLSGPGPAPSQNRSSQ